MKCNYKSKLPKQQRKQHIIRTEDLRVFNAYFEKAFAEWRRFSGIGEDDYLKYGIIKPFKIKKTEDNGTVSVSLLCNGQLLGTPIISPHDIQDKHFNENTSFLLMHIAGWLDKADGGKYYRDIVKEFARTELLTEYHSERIESILGKAGELKC